MAPDKIATDWAEHCDEIIVRQCPFCERLRETDRIGEALAHFDEYRKHQLPDQELSIPVKP